MNQSRRWAGNEEIDYAVDLMLCFHTIALKLDQEHQTILGVEQEVLMGPYDIFFEPSESRDEKWTKSSHHERNSDVRRACC